MKRARGKVKTAKATRENDSFKTDLSEIVEARKQKNDLSRVLKLKTKLYSTKNFVLKLFFINESKIKLFPVKTGLQAIFLLRHTE